MAATDTVTLMAVGDTAPFVEPPESIFAGATSTLDRADWRFAQVERTFSDRGHYQEYAVSRRSRVSPHLASAYQSAGFDVVSLATNHALDWGAEALEDSIDEFTRRGIRVVGAGRDIAEARRPAVLERNGVRVAVLAYCSLLLPQYWATEQRTGCAPMRAHTYYAPWDYPPGAPPRIVTVPYEDDLADLVADVRAAAESADAVVVSCHWGVHFTPREVSGYQRAVARAAIDAGCDAIIGHGPHLLRGVEVYKGKPCLYSLGNFAMSSAPHADGRRSGLAAPEGRYGHEEIYSLEFGPGLRYDSHRYWNLSAVAELTFGARGSLSLSLLPTLIEAGPRPRVLTAAEPAFGEIAEFLRWASEPLGGAERLRQDGDALRVDLGAS